MAQPLVEERLQHDVLQPQLLGDLDDALIDQAEDAIDHIQAEVDVDLFFPGATDAAVPESPLLFAGIALLEPGLTDDDYALRARLRESQRATEVALEVTQDAARIGKLS